MNGLNEALLRQAGKWMDYADKDLALAQHGLTMGQGCPYHLIAYHAQQCAEKYIKALLTLHGIDFPYTHSILRLLELCPAETGLKSELADAAILSQYAVSTRYPGREDVVSESEAIESIRQAMLVRGACSQASWTLVQSHHMDGDARRLWPGMQQP